MKKVQTKNKLKGFFGLFAAFAMAIGVGVSLAPKEVVKTEAAPGATVYTMDLGAQNSAFGTSNSYGEKTGTIGGVQWKMSRGSAQSAAAVWVGSNSKRKANLVLSGDNYNYVRAAIPGATAESTYYSALVAQSSLAKVGKFTINAITSGTSASAIGVYLVSSTGLTTNYTQVALTSGTQGSNLTSGQLKTYEFDTIPSAYYALIFYAANDYTVRGAVITFIEGAENSVPVGEVSVSPTSAEIEVGQTTKLTSSVSPSGAPIDVTWSTSAPAVATVDGTGLVTAVGVGEAIITATSTSDTTKSGSATINVSAAPVLEHLYVEGTVARTTYYAGEEFDPTGLEIYAHYDKGEDVDVTEEVTYTPSPLTLGTTSVNVNYGGKSVAISGLSVVAPDWTEVTQDFNSYQNDITSGVVDSNWNWVGQKNDATTDTRAFNSHVRIYNKGELLIQPATTKTDYRIISIEFKALNAIKYALRVGDSEGGVSQVKEVTPSANSTQKYEDSTGFRYVSILITNGSSNLQLDDLVIKYKSFAAPYDDVLSLTSNFTRESIKVGESVTVNPTILPSSANQGFQLSSSSDKVQIVGASIVGLAVGTDVKVLITTVGKTSGDVTLTEEITFDVVLETTTVAEALTLSPGNTVYLIENAKISNGFNTQYDRQIELVDSVDPTKKILIFHYGFQPVNSYNYIEGGTITFTAKISAYQGVNQFIEPQVVSYTDRVEEFATSIMTGDTEGQCETRFADYKELVLTFTEIEMTKLEESQNTVIQSALARYTAWAVHMGAKPFEEGAAGLKSIIAQNNDNSLTAMIIIGIIGLTTLAGYYFLQKKKEA